ncbi:S-adenosyl-L-methionine-dependent methyltransferase [Meira miltonrushii]|uniref:S-adenosyl-L-methionine-dependent methyltransferase n=1 Tax=Meira miltonrushii TaxID=1280837 RepID=A0A316VEY9_9BASI|nr:S-adenosyl-L-methionine-dependent methyltransferase [Meira miltonrushii]PWN34883.1 S-adenosyl-L-methionine-dependent methyltransferase [Meira miltonrushii]
MALRTSIRNARAIRSKLEAARSGSSIGVRYATTTSSNEGSPLNPSESSTKSNPKPGAPAPNNPFTVFDRDAKLQQRTRAYNNPESSREVDYVRDASMANLCERLLDVKRNFETIVELGAGPGLLRRHLDAKATGTKKIIMCDTSETALNRDVNEDGNYPLEFERRVIDEEHLPFEENSLDCVVCNGSLHWTNDLPGALVQIQRALKPDGLFIGSVCGGDTLFELRTSFQLAEQEREGGISPRISPMADSRDMVSLLSRAGFNIPTVDTDEIEVNYPSIFELMFDLRSMGESNAVIHRRTQMKRDTLLAASAIYPLIHGNVEEGTIPATYHVIYLIGWKPDASQRKPLKRGQASHSMKDILGDGGDKQE